MAARWFYPGNYGFLHQWNWLPWYHWNIIESGVKHHKPNQTRQLHISIFIWLMSELWICPFRMGKNINKNTTPSERLKTNQINQIAILKIWNGNFTFYTFIRFKIWGSQWRDDDLDYSCSESLCLIYIICVCLRIALYKTYRVFVSFSLSWVPYVASFSGFSNFDCPFGVLLI